jgi:hypothetical protein
MHLYNCLQQQEFVDYLLRIGDCTEPNIEMKTGNNIEEDLVQLQDIMISKSNNLDDFIDEVYPNLSNIIQDPSILI